MSTNIYWIFWFTRHSTLWKPYLVQWTNFAAYFLLVLPDYGHIGCDTCTFYRVCVSRISAQWALYALSLCTTVTSPLLAHRETVWHFESEVLLCEVCVLHYRVHHSVFLLLQFERERTASVVGLNINMVGTLNIGFKCGPYSLIL